MMTLTMFPLLLLSCLLFDQTVAIAPRVHQGCTTLADNLYCYGGYQAAAGGTFINATAEHITFNLAALNGATKPTINWTTIASDSSANLLVPRAGVSITAVDNTRYVIVGGGLLNTTLTTPAVLYDSSKNAWSALTPPPFYTWDGGMVSNDGSTVWLYGGRLTMDTAPSNILQLDLSSVGGTWTSHTGGVGHPVTGRYGHATAMKDQMIYYFGGFFPPASPGGQSIPVTMMNISFYNTASDQWGLINASNDGDKPGNRIYHTATYIANSTIILIYGGNTADKVQNLPLLDYCYTHDLNTHKYKSIDLDVGLTAGPRTGHSVTQYQENLLILFGYSSSGYIMDDVHILDVSDPTTPVWAGQKHSISPQPQSQPSQNNTGAIAGGVVGGVAFLAIVAGGAFYWRRRKNNAKPENDFDLYQPPPKDFVPDVSPTLFSATETNASPIQDATPSYQQQKPDEHQRESLEMTGLLKIKPSSNE